ncbi:NACHT, LRR and PYD domains-containing protein 3-like [Stegostoma tigrinum]|uniref:NACHT, LRR and PYD domains-containing protein 3-like n=1 Tax=Stegostoma tigrinum TaxID=3053191 RepID=UPI002870638A|nr:NACHT, LRR and PYD domains-containing protein 3-like [Stegostoma tigrinum]XP_059498825.1 NACHT, LRR and PYD domains-containing protein 3-like [Stegostoma tigrinum]XP_059498826.1 NACHT, LRR and PYD domains-containing protein 3-like [Stegostoma tigrinum]XP_059498827.1 NACHT, LRR and PYD domains-containing protein 3-like [Stegostoma tigrinum]
MFSKRSFRGVGSGKKRRSKTSLPATCMQMDSSTTVSTRNVLAHGVNTDIGLTFDPMVCATSLSSGKAPQTTSSLAPTRVVMLRDEELNPVTGSVCFRSANTSQTESNPDCKPGGSFSFGHGTPLDQRMGDRLKTFLSTDPMRSRNLFAWQNTSQAMVEQGDKGKARAFPWTLGWGRKKEVGCEALESADQKCNRPRAEPESMNKLGTGHPMTFGDTGGSCSSQFGDLFLIPGRSSYKGGGFSQCSMDEMDSGVSRNIADPFSYREPGSVMIDADNQIPVKQTKNIATMDPCLNSLDDMELESINIDKNLVASEQGQRGSDTAKKLRSNTHAANDLHTTVEQGVPPVKKTKPAFSSDFLAALEQPETDDSAAIRQMLKGYTDIVLRKVTVFYRQRIEEAIEGSVEVASKMLLHDLKTNYHLHGKIQQLVKDGSHQEAAKYLLDSIMESGAQAGRAMWETFAKMKLTNPKLSKILQEIESKGATLPMEVSQSLMESRVSNCLKEIQIQHKKFLRQQNADLLVNIIGGKKNKFSLEDHYTEQVIIVSNPEQSALGRDLTVRGKRREDGQRKMVKSQWETVRIGQLFRSSFGKSSLSGTVVVSGPAGFGKTTMIQKIVHDSADGKMYQQFQFVFLFKFRDLNTITGRTSIKKLILNSYPHFGNRVEHLWEEPQGLLFILDSLEEFKEKIDFTDFTRNALPEHQCSHPECLCEVSDIVRCLIQQKVLKGCSVLLTTRPTELETLRKAEVNLWTEIIGFLKEQRKEYLTKYFGDQRLAEAAFTYLEGNEILYSMCDNPSYCRIICYSLAPGLRRMQETHKVLPTTITQLFASYILNIFKNHEFNIYKHHTLSVGQMRDLVLRTGELAYMGICNNVFRFNETQLNYYNLKQSHALPGFLIEHTDPDTSQSHFSFIHLTLQEFIAALSKYLTTDAQRLPQTLTQLLDSPDRENRFKIFLRFMVGLSSPGSVRIIKNLLGPLPHQVTCSVIDWVKKQTEINFNNTQNNLSKHKLLESLYYLFESQHTGLIQCTVGSGGILSLGDDFPYSAIRLTLVDCTVLATVICHCDEIQEVNLNNCCLGTEGIQRLGSALHKCKALRLQGNNLTDEGVKLLSDTLKRADCKIQILDLSSNSISHTGVQELAKGLSSNSSLTQLNLSKNKVGDNGVRSLCEALSSPHCKIQTLLLCQNLIRGDVVDPLVSTLSNNRSLTDLNLNNNKLGDRGVRLLIGALGQWSCTLQTLELEGNGISDAYTMELTVTPITNMSLMKVNLSNNSLTDKSVNALQTLIQRHTSLQDIRLQRNKFTSDGANCLQSLCNHRSRLCVEVYTSITSKGFGTI